MITAIIIDDEERSRLALKNMLLFYCKGVEVLELADSVPGGVKAIQRLKPDLVFLDIEMPVYNGFELFEFLPDLQSEVVFTTAYDQYAVQAFKVSAVDYLLKPIDLEELRETLVRIKKKKNRAEVTGKYRVFQENLPQPAKKLGLPTSDGFHYVDRTQLIRCEADSNYTRFYIKGGERFLVPKTLKEYEGLLTGNTFIRVHRSHIINIDFVIKYTRTRIPKVTMIDGTIISISLKMKDKLLELLGKL